MRKEILDTIIKHQKELVENLKKNLNTYESSTDLDEESTIDLDDQSHQADWQDMQIEIAQKLKMEQDDLATIQTLRLRDSDEVREGAVVETPEHYLFIGFTFTPINHNGKKILGLSTEAPAYAANEHKKKGDEMILGDKSFEILDIY